MTKGQFLFRIHKTKNLLSMYKWGCCSSLRWSFKNNSGVIHFRNVMDKLGLTIDPNHKFYLTYERDPLDPDIYQDWSDTNQGYRLLCLGIYKEYMLETKEYELL